MTRPTSFLILSYLLLVCTSAANAQNLPPEKRKIATYNYDFVRGENVVFFDDFKGYEDSVKPYRWEILGETSEHTMHIPTKVFTKRIDSFQTLYFKYGNGPLAQPAWDTAGYTEKYNDNYWSVEFDFKLIITRNNSGACAGIHLADSSGSLMVDFARWDKVYVGEASENEEFFMSAHVRSRQNYYHTEHVDYPVKFNRDVWHHYALALSPKMITGYVDRCKFITLPGPYSYLPSLKLDGRASFAIKNFMIARTDSAHRRPPEESIAINTLLTEKKFVTHAITFDKNKAELKPQSMTIVNQLAALLKANPAVRLQINGHTDSDGTPASNMSLSLRRAEAIKKKLVSLGIAEGRLQVKGFGATQPIATNTTAGGMEQNRRVEFVRL